MSVFTISVGFKGLVAFGWGASAFPNADLLLAVLIAGAAGIFFTIAYSQMAALAPRAGGDYVYVSRFLHPALGFASSVNILLVNILWFAVSSILTAFILIMADSA